MAKQKTAKSRRRVPLHLEEEEIKQLVAAAARLGRNGPRDSAMILLAFHHGLRASEVCRLKWDQVFLERQDIAVWRCKNSKSNTHPLFPDDVAALKRLGPDRTGFVFKSEAKRDPGPVSESGFFRIVNRAGKEAGLGSHVHPHALRHSCGFWLRKQRYELLTIADWLGHVNVQNTQLYAAAGADHFREVGLGRIKPA